MRTMLSNVKLPFELPTIELSRIELPMFDVSSVDVPSPEMVIEWFRDAVFAGSGLVALTAERVTELQKQVVERVTSQLRRAAPSA